jgi:hypothetical protein
MAAGAGRGGQVSALGFLTLREEICHVKPVITNIKDKRKRIKKSSKQHSKRIKGKISSKKGRGTLAIRM